MSKAIGTTAQTMKDVNARLPVQQMAKDMQEFSKQQTMMDMKGEVMDETLDSMLEIDEGEEDRVIEQVLDEIGIETKEKVLNKYKSISLIYFFFSCPKCREFRRILGQLRGQKCLIGIWKNCWLGSKDESKTQKIYK